MRSAFWCMYVLLVLLLIAAARWSVLSVNSNSNVEVQSKIMLKIAFYKDIESGREMGPLTSIFALKITKQQWYTYFRIYAQTLENSDFTQDQQNYLRFLNHGISNQVDRLFNLHGVENFKTLNPLLISYVCMPTTTTTYYLLTTYYLYYSLKCLLLCCCAAML